MSYQRGRRSWYKRLNPEMSYNLGVLVVGDPKVGKTSLISCYGEGEYPEEYSATVGKTYLTSITINKEDIEISIHDTGGSTKHADIRQKLYNKAHIFIICFDLCDRKSFSHVEQFWLNEIKRIRGDVPFMIVGCKSDERMDNASSPHSSHVQYKEALQLAYDLNCYYYECSVVTQRNVKRIFDKAVKIAMDLEPQAMAKKQPKLIELLSCISCRDEKF